MYLLAGPRRIWPAEAPVGSGQGTRIEFQNSHFDVWPLPSCLKENSHFFFDGNSSSKYLISLLDGRSEMPAAGAKRAQFPLLSHLSGKFDAETGSHQTASSASKSLILPIFMTGLETCANTGPLRRVGLSQDRE